MIGIGVLLLNQDLLFKVMIMGLLFFLSTLN